MAQFDTTTTQEKQAAEAAAKKAQSSGQGKLLGRTVASLGDPSDPGIWIKTPLVSKPSKGRVVYPANGKAVQLELIPIEGPATAGSRMSLAALRVIEAPLTELPEVDVYSE
ncbi:D-galactarate dehydratase [Rhodobacteraceae bacterium D3-12]|nr:D-galactarate dehydratase [Rhodobacteraceae bacterium D3-12]